jgi:hypothetical protein
LTPAATFARTTLTARSSWVVAAQLLCNSKPLRVQTRHLAQQMRRAPTAWHTTGAQERKVL